MALVGCKCTLARLATIPLCGYGVACGEGGDGDNLHNRSGAGGMEEGEGVTRPKWILSD